MTFPTEGLTLVPHAIGCPMLWKPGLTPDKSRRCVRCGQLVLLQELSALADLDWSGTELPKRIREALKGE